MRCGGSAALELQPYGEVMEAARGYLAEALTERDTLYAKTEMTDEDGMRLGELEGIVGEEDGYTAESDAAILLQGLDIADEFHERKMGELQGGQKVRVLLAQALFGKAFRVTRQRGQPVPSPLAEAAFATGDFALIDADGRLLHVGAAGDDNSVDTFEVRVAVQQRTDRGSVRFVPVNRRGHAPPVAPACGRAPPAARARLTGGKAGR